MHSARTEPASGRFATVRGWFQRLNVRLVIALASTAAVALLVSGVALSQILPGYFVDQAARSSRTAAATGLLLDETVRRVLQQQPQCMATPELRNTQFFQPVAQMAADSWRRAPSRSSTPMARWPPARSRRAERDAEASRRRAPARLGGPGPERERSSCPFPASPMLEVTIAVSQPYTSRLATLQRVSGTLVFAGLIALAVSMVVGAVVARRMTARWRACVARRAGWRRASWTSVRRASASSRSTSWAQQFNVMADRLSESLRMLEADRDRLREFVADVTHELRTPIAALRAFTELQRDGQVDEAQRARVPGPFERADQPAGVDEHQPARPVAHRRRHLPARHALGRPARPDPLRGRGARRAGGAARRLAGERGAASPVMLPFDRERIVQLLTNLVGNGLKFTPRGGEVVVALADDRRRGPPGGARLGPGHPGGRAAARLRALLPRHERRRCPRLGQRAGAGDRPLDRRDARRADRGGQRDRRGIGLHRAVCPVARPCRLAQGQ